MSFTIWTQSSFKKNMLLLKVSYVIIAQWGAEKEDAEDMESVLKNLTVKKDNK